MKEKGKKIILLFCSIALLFSSAILLTACGEPTTMELSKPTNIVFDEELGVISWTPVSFAQKYEVVINGEKKETTTASIPFKYTGKSFSVEIKAFPNNNSGAFSSEEIVYTPSKSVSHKFNASQKITGIEVQDGILHWDAIDGIQSYRLKVNGVYLQETIHNNFYDQLHSGQSYKIYIVPCSNNSEITYINNLSNEILVNILESPVCKFDKQSKTITWNSVQAATGYKIKINREGQDIDSKIFGASELSYSYNFIECGEYNFRVQALINGDNTLQDSKYSSPLQVIKLVSPKDINIETNEQNVTTINFNKVIGADFYELYENNKLIRSETRNGFEYKNQSKNDNEELFTLTIKSRSNKENVLNSEDASKIEITKLATPTNFVVENGIAKWSAVNKSQKYILYIDDNPIYVNALSYKINSLGVGTHTISLKAMGNNSNILNSNVTVSKEIYKLKKPTNLKVSKGILTWNPVTNAHGYVVKINNREVDCNNNSYLIENADVLNHTMITVKAKGDSKFIFSSEYSDHCNIYKLKTPILQINNTNITWDTIDNAVNYELTINTSVYGNLSGGSYSWDNIDTSGSKRIKVKAVGDNQTYFDSNYSAIRDVTKLDKLDVTTKKDGFYWKSCIGASGYSVSINNAKAENFGKEVTKITPKFKIAKNNTIKFRVLGNGIDTISSSEMTIEHETIALAKPIGDNLLSAKTELDELIITINKQIKNATAYNLEYGGNNHANIDIISLKYTIRSLMPGEYNFRYKAVGDGFNFVDSDYSAATKFIILNTTQNIRLEYQTPDSSLIKWDAVDNALTYDVYLTKYNAQGEVIGEENKLYHVDHCSLQMLTIDKTLKYITVRIICKGNGTTIVDSIPAVALKLQCLGE